MVDLSEKQGSAVLSDMLSGVQYDSKSQGEIIVGSEREDRTFAEKKPMQTDPVSNDSNQGDANDGDYNVTRSQTQD